MSSIADRTESGSYLGLVITAGSLFLLPWVIPAPRPFFLILGGFGFFLTLAYGVSPVYKIFGGLMLGLAVAGYLVNLAEPRPDPHDFLSPQDRAIDAATIDRTLSEPVQMPVALGFVPVHELWTDTIHVYQSTEVGSAKQARRVQGKTMAYYERELSADWAVVRSEDAVLVMKDPDSTTGIAVLTSAGGGGKAGVVTLEIHALYCDSDRHCS